MRRWIRIDSCCCRVDHEPRVRGGIHEVDLRTLPSLQWADEAVHAHAHHHHRFDAKPTAPVAPSGGTEVRP